MIKQLFFTLVCVVSTTLLLQAQCIPDTTHTSPGIYPDTITNLPVCYANFPYAGVITAVVPADTNLPPVVPVDSMGVKNVVGLPTGFIWTTNSHSNYWHGGKTGCFVITGTATHSQVGTYRLTIYANGYAMGFLVPDTVFGFKIIVKDSVMGVDDGYNNGENVSILANNDASANNLTITVHSSADLKLSLIHI